MLPTQNLPSCRHYFLYLNVFSASFLVWLLALAFVVGFPLGYTVKGKDEPHAIWTSGTVASDPDVNIIINNTELLAFLIDSKTR